MKKFKRVVWFGFASCVCAGLLLVGGEQFPKAGADAVGKPGAGETGLTANYCPIGVYTNNGINYYYCQMQGACNTQYYTYSTVNEYTLGTCSACPDPITVTTVHPSLVAVPMSDLEQEISPEPDPVFSGILR